MSVEVVQVLDGDRYAVERTQGVAGHDIPLGMPGHVEGEIPGQVRKRVDPFV